MKIGLEAVVSYLPEKVVKREDFAYLDPVIPKGMEEMFRGADEFRRMEGEDAVEVMGEEVTKKVLDRAGLKPEDIDYIIAANLGGKYMLPMVGTHIHHSVGFPEDVPVLNIQTCCASFVDGFNLGWNLILSGRHKRVLVVAVTATGMEVCGADQTSPLAKNFGDGAGAAIVSSQNLKCEFLSYHNRTFGELYDHMNVKLRPVMNPQLKEKAGVESDVGMFVLADAWFFQWAQEKGKRFAVEGIEKALKPLNLGLGDVDMVVIHHPQEFMQELWIQGGAEAGIPRGKWKELYHKIANCGNVDVAAILAELLEKEEIPKDSIIALFPPGLGGHTPCMIIKWLG
jgi:3-oxoacyl-[acyl-carrier-protein] synthase-3